MTGVTVSPCRTIVAPMAMQMIGNDSGSRFRASGNQAASAMSGPTPVDQRI
ncbi:hypothetical protein [Rhizorhabdus sp. FW153]|uniref:hypothetical protein n=1 Tax=Rhizorhabdus sp. FW153 TaxID=3400216 RepID=UPI003CE8753F